MVLVHHFNGHYFTEKHHNRVRSGVIFFVLLGPILKAMYTKMPKIYIAFKPSTSACGQNNKPAEVS
jgi:hypothetical protein